MKLPGFAQRNPLLTGVGGGVAAALIAVGGYTAAACSCITPIVTTTTTTTTTSTTTAPSGTLGGVTVANLWLTAPSEAASPGSCTRSASPATYDRSRSCGGSQLLDQAVGTASVGDTIGVPGGIYSKGYQTISYESRLHNLSPGCDPLGTWGAVSTTNCIRFAPQLGTRVFFNFGMEDHTGGIWIDGSATGNVTDRTARTYSFKFPENIDAENSDPPYAGVDHVTFTGVWAMAIVMLGCQNCRFSQMEIGPRMHGERVGTSDCPNGGFPEYDGTVGTGLPNPSDFTAPKTAPPTGYTGNPNETSFGGRNGVNLANAVADHIYYFYTENVADAICDPHDGGMFIRGNITSLTIADSVWQQNEGYDVQVQNVGGAGPSNNVTFENNWFGENVNDMRSTAAGSAGCVGEPNCHGPGGDLSPAGKAIQIDEPVTGWIFRYNSFGSSQLDDNFSGLAGGCNMNAQVYGNTGQVPTCNGGSCTNLTNSTFAKNVWDGGTCSGTDTSATASNVYTSATVGPTMNYYLKGAAGSTAADNFVTGAGTTAPSNSIDGTAVGSSPWDAGAQQR